MQKIDNNVIENKIVEIKKGKMEKILSAKVIQK